MEDIKYPKPSVLPQVLSIDEFKGNAGGEKFQAILTDPKNHKIFDILPSRTQYKLKDYLLEFQNRKDVRYFTMDMNYVYRDIAETYFPNANIVIDRFHVVRYITWALENAFKRICILQSVSILREAGEYCYLIIGNLMTKVSRHWKSCLCSQMT